MIKKPRGLALIINNDKYDEGIQDKYPKRCGSFIDANNMEELFKQLGFKV